MAVNNTSDYHKDMMTRTTLPHVIGFRNSILILIPELILISILWITLLILGSITIITFIIGTLILFQFGYIKWYRGYFKIKEPYQDMARDWEPKSLDLIYNFNLIMSLTFFLVLL